MNYFNTPVRRGFANSGNLLNTPVDGDTGIRSSDYDGGDPMPVFRPGQVSADPEPSYAPRVSAAGAGSSSAAQVGPPASNAGDDDASAISKENALPELPPFVDIPGASFPYLKTMTARNSREMADIAGAQYPGATIRTGVTGRPLITMPASATHIEAHTAPSWGDGPDFALEEVPIGGQEFQLDAPDLTLRDVANGGAQTAWKVGNALYGALEGGTVGEVGGPAAGLVAALARGARRYQKAGQQIEDWAHEFGSKQ